MKDVVISMIHAPEVGLTRGNKYKVIERYPDGIITVLDDQQEVHTLSAGNFQELKISKVALMEKVGQLEARIVELERLMRDLVVIPFERQPVVAYGGLAR